ncbi:hypothetical protein [Actinocrinis sp.]|uniref:hypothetical protein n=1 Tax=Actinocrinis sp. TaxID=1920516 RepID=UPI002D24583E|nr:hypothetical protein [Actinocrinis sp.]HZP55023.1 hypothetical protein [Actinocrinis sp.]
MVGLTVLSRFPRWLRRLLLGANLAAALAILVNWWLAIWPNLAASWEVASAGVAVAVPVRTWLGRKIPQWQEHIARRAAEHTAAHMTEHHETTRAHVTEQLAAHAAAQGERMQVISDQIAALNQRLDQQQGGQS